MFHERSRDFVSLRRNHPAWLLLASRNGPLVLSSLQAVVENHPNGVVLEEAVEQLSGIFAEYANDVEFETGNGDDFYGSARREVRQWIRRGLIVERDGRIMATDALQRALAFLEDLKNRGMTSTASRLATVQREIESLEARLSTDQAARSRLIREKVAQLEGELAAVERGEFEILAGQSAEEGIREVYQLAISLRADFRRVEDSYREADLALRQRIIGERHHRGEILDELLTGHETLVNTPEGKVFESFHQQLVQTADLDRMKGRLRSILDNPNSDKALQRRQKSELRQLVPHLVGESARVIQARARSERDVRSFLTSGLADEQLRVGAVLQEIFRIALDVDWQSQGLRRLPSPLPPVAVSCPNLPLIERLLIKEPTNEGGEDIDLTVREADPTAMNDEFWFAYRALDRAALFESTISHLRERNEAVTLLALAKALPPTHDLETLAYWLVMARSAGIQIDEGKEEIDLFHEEDGWFRFQTPLLRMAFADVKDLNQGEME
jgi:hypothetical protein